MSTPHSKYRVRWQRPDWTCDSPEQLGTHLVAEVGESWRIAVAAAVYAAALGDRLDGELTDECRVGEIEIRRPLVKGRGWKVSVLVTHPSFGQGQGGEPLGMIRCATVEEIGVDASLVDPWARGNAAGDFHRALVECWANEQAGAELVR